MQILTKGDNNSVDDSFGIYARGQQFLGREHIIGRAKAYLLPLFPPPCPSTSHGQNVYPPPYFADYSCDHQ